MKFWHVLSDLEPYILQTLLGAIALGTLLKDWQEYGKKFGRFKWALLLVTVVVICLTLLDTHTTRRETREKDIAALKREAHSEGQITDLQDQVKQEREENKQNANGFRQSFDALYQKYSELAAKTQNSELLKELSDTKKQLKSAEAKFEQPKATLTASFWTSGMTPDNLSRETTVLKRPDGSVTVDIVVLNRSDVAALNGAYTIRICEGCKFAKEPAGLSHFAGSGDQDRQKTFDRILSKMTDEVRTIEIVPPTVNTLLNRFEIDVIYSCVNCIADRVPLWVTTQ